MSEPPPSHVNNNHVTPNDKYFRQRCGDARSRACYLNLARVWVQVDPTAPGAAASMFLTLNPCSRPRSFSRGVGGRVCHVIALTMGESRLAQKEIRVTRAKTQRVLRQSLQKIATVRPVSSFPMTLSQRDTRSSAS